MKDWLVPEQSRSSEDIAPDATLFVLYEDGLTYEVIRGDHVEWSNRLRPLALFRIDTPSD